MSLQIETRSPHPTGRRCAHGRRPTTLLLLALGSLLPWSAWAQGAGDAVRYHVDLSQRAHHEARISVTFSGLDQDVLEVRMSRSSPGRYALHEFAKNVYSVSAQTADGEALRVDRADPHQWNVMTDGASTVIFRYTLFADRVDGTYSAVDRSHGHFNGPATFAWARGLDQRPVRVTFDAPATWRVASQLVRDGDAWTAPDLQYFLDSPIEISEHWETSWTIPGPATAEQPHGAPDQQTVRIALHHEGSEELAEVYAELTAAIVDEQIAIYGEAPAFDYGEYVFLADYLPWASGDGMEHRNSTILSSSSSLEDRLVGLLGTVSHEFLHAWNIERIRPRSLEPFDFERANMSEALWFGEGFTSYYDDLTLKRAGVLSFESYVEGLSGSLGFFLAATGRRFHSPQEMSHQAPFVDAASWIDRGNRANTFISYYTYGAMLGLGLDLELRTRFGVPLDAYMREVWRRHGRTEIPYTMDDLQAALAAVSNEAFAREFFARSVHGSEVPDYGALLEAAGVVLEPQADEGWIGFAPLVDEAADDDGHAIRITAGTRVDSPLYAAGLDLDDRILQVDGEAMTAADLESLVLASAPGTTFAIDAEGRGAQWSSELVVAANPRQRLVTFEAAGRDVTPEIEAFRAAWLGRKGDRDLEATKVCSEGGEVLEFAVKFCPEHGDTLIPTPPGSMDG